MLRILNEVSPWVVALVVVAAAEIYSISLMLICRRRWGTDRLSLNNEVAEFKFASSASSMRCCVPSWVAVWEDYRDTEAAVRNEAKALADLHQVSYALPRRLAATSAAI